MQANDLSKYRDKIINAFKIKKKKKKKQMMLLIIMC